MNSIAKSMGKVAVLMGGDSAEREVTQRIIGADISPAAASIAERNIKSAGVAKYIDLSVKPMQSWLAQRFLLILPVPLSGARSGQRNKASMRLW